MKDILDYIDGYLNDLNKKYSSIVQAVEFSPKINLVIDKLPEQKGKSMGQKTKAGDDYVFWNGKAWLPSDIFNGSLKLVEDKLDLKALDPEEEKILNKAIENITGSFNAKSLTKAYEDSQKEYYDLKEKGKDTKEIEKVMEQAMKGLQEKSREALQSREKALRQVSESLGKDTAKKLKKVILRTDSKSDVEKSVKKSLTKSRSDENERKDNAYVPKLDSDKKQFNAKDQRFMIGLIKKYHKEGLQGIQKRMKKYFNGDLINEVTIAARRYGGMPGLMKYFSDYHDNRKNLLREDKPEMPKLSPAKEYVSLSKHIKAIKPFLERIRKENTREYYGSTFEDLNDALDVIQEYQRSDRKDVNLETYILNLFGTEGKILSKMRRFNLPFQKDVAGLVSEMKKLFDNNNKELLLEIDNVKRDDSGKIRRKIKKDDNKWLKEIKSLINESEHEPSEEELELAKKYRKEFREKKKEIRDKDLSKEEIKERNKKIREINKDKKEFDQWLKMSPEERIEFDKNKEEEIKNKEKKEKEKAELEKEKKERKEWREYEKQLKEDMKTWKTLSDKDKEKWEKDFGKEYTDYLKELIAEKETKRKKKKRKDDDIDVEQVKKLQDELKNKKSSYVFENIERLASYAPDRLVKAELESILRTLKTYI